MTENEHEYAERLIAGAQVEGISASDREWLDQHLENCVPCALLASATERAVRSLRTVSVRIDPGLVNATRQRVHRRARELGERRSRKALLWGSCAISWAFGVASAPYVWRGFAWLGEHAGVPKLMWQTGFVLWWVLPALAVVAAVTLLSPQPADWELADHTHNDERAD